MPSNDQMNMRPGAQPPANSRKLTGVERSWKYLCITATVTILGVSVFIAAHLLMAFFTLDTLLDFAVKLCVALLAIALVLCPVMLLHAVREEGKRCPKKYGDRALGVFAALGVFIAALSLILNYQPL